MGRNGCPPVAPIVPLEDDLPGLHGRALVCVIEPPSDGFWIVLEPPQASGIDPSAPTRRPVGVTFNASSSYCPAESGGEHRCYPPSLPACASPVATSGAESGKVDDASLAQNGPLTPTVRGDRDVSGLRLERSGQAPPAPGSAGPRVVGLVTKQSMAKAAGDQPPAGFQVRPGHPI